MGARVIKPAPLVPIIEVPVHEILAYQDRADFIPVCQTLYALAGNEFGALGTIHSDFTVTYTARLWALA